jgi:hypothetical protein
MLRKILPAVLLLLTFITPAFAGTKVIIVKQAHRPHYVAGVKVGYWVPTPYGWRYERINIPSAIYLRK